MADPLRLRLSITLEAHVQRGHFLALLQKADVGTGAIENVVADRDGRELHFRDRLGVRRRGAAIGLRDNGYEGRIQCPDWPGWLEGAIEAARLDATWRTRRY